MSPDSICTVSYNLSKYINCESELTIKQRQWIIRPNMIIALSVLNVIR